MTVRHETDEDSSKTWRQKPEECPQVIGQEVEQYMEAALRGPAKFVICNV